MTHRWRSQQGLTILEMLLLVSVVNAGVRGGLEYFKPPSQTNTGVPTSATGRDAPASARRATKPSADDGLGVLSRTQTLALDAETEPMTLSIDEILLLNAVIKRLEPQGNFECHSKEKLAEDPIFASVFGVDNGQEPGGNPVSKPVHESPALDSPKGRNRPLLHKETA